MIRKKLLKDPSEGKNTGYVFYCAGGSNAGILTYDLARELDRLKIFRINCASGIGADIKGFKESVEENPAVSLIIDGCPVSCVKTMFDNKGIKNYKQVILTDFLEGKEPLAETGSEEMARLVKEITYRFFRE
jgi:uncharacterized metal-binding protein